MNTPNIESSEMTIELRQARWRELYDRIITLSRQHEQKYSRARNHEKQDYWWDRYQMLNKFIWKNTRHNMRIPGQKFGGKFGENDGYVFGYVRRDQAITWWKRKETDRKEQGRQKFLTTRYFAPWFMSNSLGADYGEYVCDNCNRTFYHSPSTITKAGKKIISCCCGYCTNQIIKADHGNEPFD